MNDFNTFIKMIYSLKDEVLLGDFLIGITTEKEKDEFTRRLKIVEMILDKVPHHEIAQKLGVGVATVTRGSKEVASGRFRALTLEKQRQPVPNVEADLKLGEFEYPRIFKGGWQLSGGHGDISERQAIEDMTSYVDAGIKVFDTGDIYGNSEAIIGSFLTHYRKKHTVIESNKIRIHTKFVPDLNALDDLTYSDVRTIIERSIERLNVKCIDLVQFHWWDFTKGDFIQAAKWLVDLKNEGLIKSIGLTNFDTMHMKQLIDAGVPIVSNQIQFSIFDVRPLNGMLSLAARHNINIFCYGVLAGGLLSNKEYNNANRSHIKYGLVIEEVGRRYFDRAIELVDMLAIKYHTTRGNIALAYVLQTKGVSAAIVGPRNTDHLEELKTQIVLENQDFELLRNLQDSQLMINYDDVYSFERDRNSVHGEIMKYNLNGMRK